MRRPWLWLAFIGVPLLEVWLLVTLGGLIGAPAALALVIGSGLIGAHLARREGARVWAEVQDTLARGELPEQAALEGLLILVGGILLVTPGVLTDATGLLLLAPPTRRAIAKVVRRRLQQRIDAGELVVQAGGATLLLGGLGGAPPSDDASTPRRARARTTGDVDGAVHPHDRPRGTRAKPGRARHVIDVDSEPSDS